MQYAYRDRKNRKRTFRALWIQRLNAAVREHGLTYSRFIDGLGKAGIEVDRKVLSEMAIHEPAAFAAYVERAKASLPQGGGLTDASPARLDRRPRRSFPASPRPSSAGGLRLPVVCGAEGLTSSRSAPHQSAEFRAGTDDRSHRHSNAT